MMEDGFIGTGSFESKIASKSRLVSTESLSESVAEEVNSWLIQPDEVQFIREIAEGRTASVLLSQYRGLTIVVKEIKNPDENVATAFERELCVLTRVRHPHIVSFLGVISSTDETRLRLCLEYCEGGSLFNLLYGSTNLAWWQRTVMLYDLASAVEYLHSFSPPLVHRDLKSLNVLLRDPIFNETDEPFAKLCDFGFARDMDARMTAGAGTNHWRAPEVTCGTVYTTAADSFSFAMVIYEVMCRRVPFMDANPSDVPRLLTSGVRPGLTIRTESGEVAQLPKGLMELMQRCWDQDPHKRPGFTTICAEILDVNKEMPEWLKLQTSSQLFGEQYSL